MKGLDRLTRSGQRIGQGNDFGGKVALIANVAERTNDRRHIGMTEANRLTVGIGEVNMPDERARVAKSSGEIGFLDIHVKKIGEDADVCGFQGAQPCRSVADATEEI